MKGGMTEKQTVNRAVDHVAGSAGKYQRDTHQQKRVGFLLHQRIKIPPDGCYGSEPE